MFSPDKHYLILTRGFVECVRQVAGKTFDHATIRGAMVAAIPQAATWKPTPNRKGAAYIVAVTVFGVDMDLRVNFGENTDGSSKVAPDGVKTILYAHRAYKPRAPTG